MTLTPLIVIAVTAILVAFLLSAADSALLRISRNRAEQLAEDGRAGSRALLRIVEDSAPYLAVATFVRVLFEAVAAVMVTVAVDTLVDSHWRTALIAVAIMVVVSFVIVGVSPRTLGRQHADTVALLAAPVVRVMRVLLGPLARLLIAIGNALTPGRGWTDGPFDSEADLRELVDLAGDSALIEAGEREMIHSIFELGDTVAREVMVPRPDMVTISGDKMLGKAMSLFLRSGYSRVPVVGEGADDVLGVLFFKDVVRQVNANAAAATAVPVTEVMRPVQRIPESKQVDQLLKEMQQEHSHFAIVIDEYGGTSGLVTIEDILEEIVGEITDEYDRDADEVEHLEDGRVRVPASMAVDDLGELFDEEIEVEDVDTVGGLLASLIGMVPIQGSTGRVADLELVAERMAGRRRRVATVLVRRVQEEAPVDEPEGRRGTPGETGPGGPGPGGPGEAGTADPGGAPDPDAAGAPSVPPGRDEDATVQGRLGSPR